LLIIALFRLLKGTLGLLLWLWLCNWQRILV
jgi:hypothetical protein